MSVLYLILGTSAALVLYTYAFRKRDLDYIPTVGYSDPILSYISSIRRMFDTKAMLEEGYRQYPNSAFKIAALNGWSIILNGSHYVHELRLAHEDKLSAFEPTRDFFQFDHTLGSRISENRFHSSVIRTVLTRNIGSRFQDMHEVVMSAYNDNVPAAGKEWIKVKALPLHLDVISKVSLRFFVGVPLCENTELRSICENIPLEMLKGRMLKNLPPVLRPFASRWFLGIHGLRSRMETLLAPIICERLEQESMHGPEWPGKPNDLLSWLIDGARTSKEEVTLSDISSRMIFICFGAINTSSMIYTGAMYQIALSPADALVLRQEVEQVVKEEGWSKESLKRMFKLDSYLRETLRVHSMGMLNIARTAKTDYVFADGLHIPVGANICVNSYSRHLDDTFYRDAHVFDGFRFAKEGGEDQLNAATPTQDYHTFGCGRPACPGRFFAMAELKLMTAHVVLHYDLKLEADGYPSETYVESIVLPNTKANILFRERADKRVV